jgi:hypothetical protein
MHFKALSELAPEHAENEEDAAERPFYGHLENSA